jgi:hypothetical protein
MKLTAERLREQLHYDGLDNRSYRASRLAWLYMSGAWPDQLIDHINGDTSDDRFVNLRPASQSENHVNSCVASHNTSGLKGVNFYKRYGKWRAFIQKEGKQIHIGYFDTIQEAYDARVSKAQELFGEFARAA